jgi:hypothetical protein
MTYYFEEEEGGKKKRGFGGRGEIEDFTFVSFD